MIEVRQARFDELDEISRAMATTYYCIPIIIEVKPDVVPDATRT